MASSPRCNPKYSDIDAAVRKLPIIPKHTPYVERLVDDLALMGNIIDGRGGDLTAPPNLRPATKGMVVTELVELERRANGLAGKLDRKGRTRRAREQLARHIRELHSPTIEALSEVPEVILPYFQSELPNKLERDEVTSSELRFWARIAHLVLIELNQPSAKSEMNHSADGYLKRFPDATRIRGGRFESPRTQDVGRLPNRLAANVAGALARGYFILTGTEPIIRTISGKEGEGKVYGPYFDFFKEIWDVLDIRADAATYAAGAAHDLRGRGRKK